MKTYLILFALLVSACVHHPVLVVNSDSGSAEKKGVIFMQMLTIKNKDKKYDINMKFENQTGVAQIIWLKDMKCSRGKTVGVMSYYGSPSDVPVRIPAKDQREFIFTCKLPVEHLSGEFKLNVTRVFSNPNDDGRTTKDVVAENLSVSQ